MTATSEHIDKRDQLDRIEAKLDAILAHLAEVQPLVEAGQELAEKLQGGGPMALLNLMKG